MVRNYKRKTEDRWSKEDLLEALICIKEAKLKINDAARQYGISRATLYRQYQKFILAGGKCDVNQFRTCGGNPILTKVEEDVLEKTIRDLREQGFTVTSSDIKRICFEYCDSNGIPNQFNQEKRMASDDWYYGFLKRHPDVRIPKSGNAQNRTNRSSSENSAAVELDGNMTMEAILVAAASAPDKPIKTKKLKTSPSKKIKQENENSSKSPIHIIPTISNSSVTVVTSDEQMFQQQLDTIMSSGNRGKKQNHPAPAASNHVPSPGKDAGAMKKPLKRLSGNPNNKGRGRKNNAQIHTIPIPAEEEYVKEEMGEHEEVEEEQVLGIEMEQDEVMETEEADEEEEEDDDDEEDDEEEDEEEEAADEPQVEESQGGEEEEQEDVEMEEENEEEQDEAEKSESEEEEEGEEDDAENDEEEEGEADEQEEAEEQEEGEEDAENDADNDAEEGEAEEGEAEEGEEDDDEEEDEDEDEEEEEETKGENDESGSDVDCTNDDELLEKLLDM